MKKKNLPYLSWEEVRWEASITDADLSDSNQKILYDQINEMIDRGEEMLDGPNETFSQKKIAEIKKAILNSIETLKLSKLKKSA